MDFRATSCLAPTFFFEQASSRRIRRRCKKLPEELPQDLKFAYIAPRVGAYMADKGKDNLNISEHDADFGDGLGQKSLLPQISATVTLLQHQLNNAFSNDEDSQRLLFERAKVSAGTVIQQLSRILYIFKDLHIGIPRPLEQQLTFSFKDLTSEVNYVAREWQCPENKEEYTKKRIASQKEDPNKSSEDIHTETGSISNVSRHTLEDDTRSVKSGTGKDANAQQVSRTHPVGKMGSRTSHNQLQDIAEDNAENIKIDNRADLSTALANVRGKSFQDKVMTPNRARSKTRLDRLKFPGVTPSGIGTESRASGNFSHRSNVGNRFRHDDLYSIQSASDGTFLDRGGALIQFQLSSRQCDEKGWIVHPELGTVRETETVLQWAVQKLKKSVKQRKLQESADKERGRNIPIVVRYYGDSRRDMMARQTRNVTLTKGPERGMAAMPTMPDKHELNKQIFMITASDGSTTIYYPSGLPAVVTSCSLLHKDSFYTLVFDDTADRCMLAAFTPSGRGCCYHKNGVVRFLSSEKEWTIAEEDGAITRRSKWPSSGINMYPALSIQLNSYMVLRCKSHSTMFLHFSAVKDSTKVPVFTTCSQDSQEGQAELLSGLPFTSQAAKDLLRSQKSKTHHAKVPKPKGKNKQSLEIQKLMDMPEPTVNDADADRILYRLQRKIKNLVEDWLEHYRIALGISSPHLRNLYSTPMQRNLQSASSSPGGVRIIIESLSTAVPHVVPSPRIPSAPAGS